MNNKTGIELIAHERAEQIIKHERTLEHDSKVNAEYQLKDAAIALLADSEEVRLKLLPVGWDVSVWQKMARKTYTERVTIAGALLASELDRLTFTVEEYIKASTIKKLSGIYESIKDEVHGAVGFNTTPAAKVVLDKLSEIRDIAVINIVK